MSSMEMHQIFKKMVRDEIEAGTLTLSRRQRLVRYGQQIGLSPLHANMLIYEARREMDLDPLETPSWLDRLGFLNSLRWFDWMQVGVAILLAAAIHVVLGRLLG